LSAIGASVPTLQESKGQVRDHVGLRVNGEATGVQHGHFGTSNKQE
jgi:hypothetical protein